MADEIDVLTEEVLVDAYGFDEQLWAFRQAFEDRARFPIAGQVVGVPVDVVEIDYDGDERRGLVAICRRSGELHRASLLDVTPGPVSLETARLLVAYRRWSGAEPLDLPGSTDTPARWVYESLVAPIIGVGPPLGLQSFSLWDPEEEYWGEPGDPIDPLLEPVIAAGPRPEYEMEQVTPGTDIDDLDDPIVHAADLHRAGYDREAVRLLEGLLDDDRRCIDAHVHLGLIAFDGEGPKAALPFYEAGVAVGEQALPDGFAGVLPWGLVDNRPFLRALHGLGLCAWRQRRWDDADRALMTRVWLDPTHSMSELACLCEVRARRRWRR